MYSAIVLINVKRTEVKNVANALKKVDGVKNLFSTAGEYDLVAMVQANDKATFSEIITDKIIHCDNVLTTKTLFSLEQFK